MASLVTFEQAVKHLRLQGVEDQHRDDVLLKMDQATAVVLAYIGRSEAETGWQAGSPGSPGGGSPNDDAQLSIVQAAILDVLGNLFGDRGDREKATDGPLTERAANMLMAGGLKVPSLA